MFCTRCGKQIEDDAIYCNYCGNKIEKIEVEKLEDKIEKVEKLEDKNKIEKVEKLEDKNKIEKVEVEKLEDKNKIEKVEVEKLEKIEEKIESVYNIIKGINIPKVLTALCAIGLIASIVNIFRFYISGIGINYIFGQMIFGLVFLVSTVLLWKSRKIGGAILISFILFKVISSIYYYFEASYGYLIKNLIYDEIFYLAIISLLLIDWRNLK